jgi:hypothetical protein
VSVYSSWIIAVYTIVHTAGDEAHVRASHHCKIPSWTHQVIASEILNVRVTVPLVAESISFPMSLVS